MKKRAMLYGLLAWLVPFVSAFPFYGKDGELGIDIFLFKSMMIVVGSTTAAILLVSYFKKVSENYLKEGVVLGIIWVGMSVLLDLIFLLPMSGMVFADYFGQIGVRYLVMPVMTVAMGKVLAEKK